VKRIFSSLLLALVIAAQPANAGVASRIIVVQ
jgi:hypothetical protein